MTHVRSEELDEGLTVPARRAVFPVDRLVIGPERSHDDPEGP